MTKPQPPIEVFELDQKHTGSVWKHLKSEGVYCIVGIAYDSEDLKPIVVYQEITGRMWTRPFEEFMDGRFELIHE